LAYVTDTTNTPSIAARITEMFEGVKLRWTRNRMARKTYKELDRLSDRDLYDLGFSRYDLARVAMESTYNIR
jgi:uncharacterized protein YjiS (DUF1127 family)